VVVINGLHSLVYSEDPEATRAFLGEVLGWPALDAGSGWLIFKTPPSELGVHPTSDVDGDEHATVPHHQLSFMCDDLEATIAELEAKGVEVRDPISDQGFGRTTSITVPGAGWVLLYEPRHPLAHEL
jgi:catechol 2,3-dioxygenase-like lactoylglutathione lyase family enzyme